MIRAPVRRTFLSVLALALAGACAREEARSAAASGGESIVVYVAASLAAPVRAAAADFERATGTRVQLESGGSLDHARKITELGRIPDLLVLADHDVFPQLLVPAHVAWYVPFARNRMVVAYTARSRAADAMDAARWYEVLARPDVEVGRPDPARAPAGYRALLMLQLAERHYAHPGLARAVLARAPSRNVRPNAAELAALLELREVDYVIEYESLARARGFRFVALPPEIDLGDPGRADDYDRAAVRIPGGRVGDSITVRGAPILYALAVPTRAPHRAAGERFAAALLGAAGAAHFRTAHVELLDTMRVVGRDAPAALDSVLVPRGR